MTTQTTTSASQLSLALRSITLQDALEAFDELDNAFHLLPDHAHDDVRSAMARYANEAARAGATNVHALVCQRTLVVHATTGVSHPTRILNSDDSAAVHHACNLLLVLALSGAASIGADTQPITDTWMNLKARTARSARALFDDEILLIRTTLAVETKNAAQPGLPRGFADCTNIDHLTRVAAYALSEAGITSSEISSVSLDDIALIAGTTYVSALGSNKVASRIIELDPFAAHAIQALAAQRTRDRAWRTSQSLVYKQGTTSDAKKSSAVCAYNRLDRIMVTAGLRNPDTTAASICNWRYQVTYNTQGVDAAMDQSGYKQDSLVKRIVLPAPNRDTNAERTNAMLAIFNPTAA